MEWILTQIERTVEQDSNPNAVYIIDYLPNLKYLLRIQDITKECAKALAKFEERVGWKKNIHNSIIKLGKIT